MAVPRPKPARRTGTRSQVLSQVVSKKVVPFAGVVSGQIHRLKSKTAAAELSPGKLIEAIR